MKLDYDYISKRIHDNGHFIINNYITEDSLQQFKNFFYQEFNSSSGNLKINENVYQLNKNKIKKNIFLKSFCVNIKNFYSFHLSTNVYLNKVWIQNTQFSKTDTTVLPYIPHIDSLRFVKAMLYIENVEENNGPIELANASPDSYEELRNKIKKGKASNIINEKLCIQKMIAKAGNIVLFDTNCPHKAGIGGETKTRKIIRFDFEPITWNTKNLFDKFKVFTKSLYF